MPVPSIHRTRWAALGAAVAVSVGAGGVGLTQATAPDGAAAFVPIAPCRLFDTRPGPHTVGSRTAPLGPEETYDVAARGEHGNCALPDAAVGVVLNVTAVDASQATFLTLFPSGAERPTASHLNPLPGPAAAPNAVTVELSDTGAFSVYNRFGTVHVLADVVGYYTDHHHDDRYYTEGEVEAVAAAVQAALDARVPVADSLTLAGGAFSPRGGELSWAPGSGCFSPSVASNGMRHTIPVTAGSTVTALDVRSHNTSVYDQQFTVTLFAQRPASSAGAAIRAAEVVIPAGSTVFESRLELPTPETADPGEALYVAFTPANQSSYLCAVEVEFTRPD